MGRSNDSSPSSSSSSESSDSEAEEFTSTAKNTPPAEKDHGESSSSSDEQGARIDPPSIAEDVADSSSSSDDEPAGNEEETLEPLHGGFDMKGASSEKLPIVLDTASSSSSSSESESEDVQVPASVHPEPRPGQEPAFSESSSSENEDDHVDEGERSHYVRPESPSPTDKVEHMHEAILEEPEEDLMGGHNEPSPRRSSGSSSSSEEAREFNFHQDEPIYDNPESLGHDMPTSKELYGQGPDEPAIYTGNTVEAKSSSSSSSSSSESEDEKGGPLVIRDKGDSDIPVNREKDPMAESLRKALEEREREMQQKRDEEEFGLGARKPSEPRPMTPDYMATPSPDAFDFNGDPSLRARTAFDCEEPAPQLPPKLPPKQRNIPPVVAPDIGVHRESHAHNPGRSLNNFVVDETHPNIFHVKDETASLGRERWSDDDDSDYPDYHGFSDHPPPDRVIDFSSNPDGDHSLKRSRSSSKSSRKRSTSRKRSKDKKQGRSRSPSGTRADHRVIDFSQQPYEDPQNVINRQALVSLHANTYDTDPYDSVPETGDELNKLIAKANSLGYHQRYPAQQEDVFPKKKFREKKLDSKHPDAFAKIVAPIRPPQQPPQTLYRASGPEQHSSDTSKRSTRSLSRKKRKTAPPAEAVDGDDEISIAESDLGRFRVPSPPPEKGGSSLPFVTEIYPSDYTEFESFSEAEFPDKQKPALRSTSVSSDDTVQEPYNPALQTGGESAYDTVADLETDGDFNPGAELNPIVSANFQICSDLSGSKSFPARLREGKPKKERPGLGHLAIPLHQVSKNKNAQPTSLPYFYNDFHDDEDDEIERVLRRTGSVDDIGSVYPIVNPSIVIHRQPTHPKGYRPELTQEVMVQSAPQDPPVLPQKKEKKKKEKKSKEQVEKPAPQIHLSVGQPEGESNTNLNNNLQINLLPSDDPNVINLNIRSSSVNPSGPQSLPVFAPQPQVSIAEPLSYRPQHPLPSTMEQRPSPISTLPRSDSQHRVVDVAAPPMVVTGDDIQSSAPYMTNAGVVLAGGIATEVLPNPIMASAAQQFAAPQIQPPPYPTISLGAHPGIVPAPVQPTVQASQSVPPATMPAPVQQPPLQPHNEATVVDINSPWPEDRQRSLPNSLRHAKEQGRMHHGDSGIDLTVHDRSRHSAPPPKSKRSKRGGSRSSHRDSSSASSEESPRRQRRKSSRKQLKSNDYLAASSAHSAEYMEWYKAKHMKPSCCYLLMKHLMFVINLIFTLAGLALVGLGIWGMIGLHTNGITDTYQIFHDPLFTVMILGFIVTLVSFHGAAGFVRDNVCMLKCFGSMLIMLFLTFVIGGIVFWVMREQATEWTEATYQQLIKQYDPETRRGLSFSIDAMQNSFQCCGISKPNDWQRNKNYECVPEKSCKLPSSCCTTEECFEFSDYWNARPCMDSMLSAMKRYTPIIIGVWVGIWALMIFELICIHFMCKEIRYLQKIREYASDPIKYMKSRQVAIKDSEDSYEDESASETSSSEEEYRRRRRRSDRKHKKSKKRDRSAKRKKEDLGRKTTSKRGRRGSYHINRSFSIQDERAARRSRRGSSRSNRSRSRSRSRSRRGSY